LVIGYTILEVKILKKEIIKAIKRSYKEDGNVTRRSFEKKPYGFASSTVRRYFQTWSNALEVSGIVKEIRSDEQEQKQIIMNLQRCFEEEGEIKRDTFISKPYGCSSSKINRLFGSWKKALIAAGLRKDEMTDYQERRKKILESITCFIKESKDNRCDYKSYQAKSYSYEHSSIMRYFGSWEVAYDIAKFGEELVSKQQLISEYELPESFVRGLQFIPALKDKIIVAGRNSRSGNVYKIPKENMDFVLQYYVDTYKNHETYSKQKGWFTLDDCRFSIYVKDKVIEDMIKEGILVEKIDYVMLDRINWKHHMYTDTIEPEMLLLHRNSYQKFSIATLSTVLNILTKQGVRTSFETLMHLRDKGFIQKKEEYVSDREVVEYFDVKEVLKVLTEYFENRKRVNNRISSFDFLNAEQQSLIDQYISARDNGVVIRWNGYQPSRIIAQKEIRLPDTKNRLANSFFCIIAHRCGVNYNGGVIDLSDEELELFDPDVFNVTDVKMDDYYGLGKHLMTNTLITRYIDLKSFYYWILMRKDLEQKKTFEDYQMFDNLQKNIESFLNQFPKTEYDAPSDEEKNSLVKVFLSRRELVQCKDVILKNIRAQYPLKNAAVWCLGFVGLRPEEMIHLRIEDFVLDENGLIALNDKGYGEVKINKRVGKGGYSVSHPIYNTPIPKGIVEQVNLYLETLYARQGPNIPRGKGYFLRTNSLAPNSKYKVYQKTFINHLRKNAVFLPETKRENLILKNTRHSLNNIMTKTYFEDPHLRENVQDYAAFFQMRHKPEGETIREKHYLEDISRDEYYAILDRTINFPWNLKELEKWELEMGLLKQEDEIEEVKDLQNTGDIKKELNVSSLENTIVEKAKKETNQELILLREQLKQYRVRDKSMSVSEWMKKRKELLQREKDLELKLLLG
jgi:integrase